MLERRMTTSGVAACVGALALMTGVSSTTVAGGALAPTERKVYVSATAEDGTAVKDMTADDFEMKEDGETREVVAAGLTTKPLRMSIIVADGGAGVFQQGLVTLLQGLINNGEFSLVSVVGQPDRIVDYTGDPETLVKGIEASANAPE